MPAQNGWEQERKSVATPVESKVNGVHKLLSMQAYSRSVRYEGGVTSYLEVLYKERELFTAELNLAQARLNELLSVVALYRSLGGGWQTRETLAKK